MNRQVGAVYYIKWFFFLHFKSECKSFLSFHSPTPTPHTHPPTTHTHTHSHTHTHTHACTYHLPSVYWKCQIKTCLRYWFLFVGPINQEMRNLIQSLQKHNQQLKAEAQRNRRKVKETQSEINKVTNLLGMTDFIQIYVQSILPVKRGIIYFSYFCRKSICYGCSLKMHNWGASNESHNMFFTYMLWVLIRSTSLRCF